MTSTPVPDSGGREPRRPVSAENYVPPPAVLNKVIRRTTGSDGGPAVTLPLDAFTKLLEAALAPGFNEALYLETNEDVKVGVEAGAIASGLKHYAAHGYFEGRGQPHFEVDAGWYLATYPDVQRAIDEGQVGDAAHHFEAFGYREGRVPNPQFQAAVGEWLKLAQRA